MKGLPKDSLSKVEIPNKLHVFSKKNTLAKQYILNFGLAIFSVMIGLEETIILSEMRLVLGWRYNMYEIHYQTCTGFFQKIRYVELLGTSDNRFGEG